MALKAPSKIEQVFTIDENTTAFVFDTKEDALLCLRRNPRAQTMEKDGQHILVYANAELDLIRSIRRL
jgi:hypothetical protein